MGRFVDTTNHIRVMRDSVPAGISIRAFALLIDVIIVFLIVPLHLFVPVMSAATNLLLAAQWYECPPPCEATFYMSLLLWIAFTIGVIVFYEPAFLTLFGATPGKMLFFLRVVRSDGHRVDLSRSLLRSVSKIGSAVPLGLGFISAVRDPERRTWHDRAADTMVIQDAIGQQLSLAGPRNTIRRVSNLWLRVGASLLDILIVWIAVPFYLINPLAAFVTYALAIQNLQFCPPPCESPQLTSDTIRHTANLISIAAVIPIAVLYEPLYISIFGGTLGSRFFRLMVIRADGKPIGFWKALWRHLAKLLSAIPLGLGFLWALWDPKEQTWHDHLAGTIIVSERQASQASASAQPRSKSASGATDSRPDID